MKNIKCGLFLGILLWGSFSQNAQAGQTGVSVGASYPTPMGNTYQTLGQKLGYQADFYLDSDFIKLSWMQLQFTALYQPFDVKNQPTLDFNRMGVFAGPQFINSTFGQGFSPFFTVQIGAVYDLLSFSGVAATGNNAVNFAASISPGFDLPIYGRFGIVGQMPVQILFKSSTLMWSPSLSVRFKL